jgi:hypothetical protein
MELDEEFLQQHGQEEIRNEKKRKKEKKERKKGREREKEEKEKLRNGRKEKILKDGQNPEFFRFSCKMMSLTATMQNLMLSVLVAQVK